VTTPAKVSTFSVKPANTCTFTYAYVAADGAYGRVAINASGGLPVYTLTALTPYADATNAIGTNALRWNGAVLAFTTAVAWSDGTHQNTLKYVDGTGPQWLDRTTTFKTTLNVQAQTADRVLSTPDQSGSIILDGNPPTDDTNALGTSALRWNSLLLALDGVIDFDDGAGNTNRMVYTDGTGPTWTDKTVSESLTFNLQSFTGSHVATWQDSAGTVAWLTDVDDAAASNLYAQPTLVTLDHTAGGTFTAGLGVPSVIFVTSDNATTILGTTTINATAGDVTGGWELVVTFLVASTTVAHNAIFTSTGGLTLAVAATAGQSFRYIWDLSASKYKRYS
jgi:hypothetical protein